MPSSSQGVCPVTANEYLYDTEETNRIRELAMGRLHEPPARFFSHQLPGLEAAATAVFL
jgi:hypothetical protein